jgi:Na+-transporting NADH:ubiquinone oxidoreductase subunit NqrB
MKSKLSKVAKFLLLFVQLLCTVTAFFYILSLFITIFTSPSYLQMTGTWFWFAFIGSVTALYATLKHCIHIVMRLSDIFDEVLDKFSAWCRKRSEKRGEAMATESEQDDKKEV